MVLDLSNGALPVPRGSNRLKLSYITLNTDLETGLDILLVFGRMGLKGLTER